MTQIQNQIKLLKILSDISQLSRSLSFEICFIVNTKSKEINEFLGKDLIYSLVSSFSKSKNV